MYSAQMCKGNVLTFMINEGHILRLQFLFCPFRTTLTLYLLYKMKSSSANHRTD